jgi:hypothetical protein
MGKDFVKRLPGCVKKTICYHAGPWVNFDFAAFDLCLSNHPAYIRRWKREGVNAAHFDPSHDPAMVEYAVRDDRPIDIAFVGTCSGNYKRRQALLNELAALADECQLHFSLTHPDFRPWVDLRVIRRIPSPFPYLPEPLRSVAKPPVFGRDLYELFGKAKVVLNVATDICGVYRGNMRCFEAMGCGACMLSDEGIYPEGMKSGEHFLGYEDGVEALQIAREILRRPNDARKVGRKGAAMLACEYSKTRQWSIFEQLVGNC